ncbi:threonine ammonia-lyase IlvA [Speluncibacter jeojiensis]|uniref:L-threonine dehydratase n=1 Tax=Speluncibacter jeojiensis TaxID=2710754 RepID=A0A9X4RCW4_9ACTN|nr:threonine ammonia-lyase IlvA [Corynebacteriales bacterium D3-21]
MKASDDSTPTTAPLTAADIDAAAERISGIITRTPLQHCERLSAATGANVFLKREDLQVVRSYKLRGAFNLMAQLGDAERRAGVVTASAGNHAQGVAYACRTLGIDGRIYVPVNTPKQKRDRIMVHGGDRVELVMVGETFDAASAAAAEDAQRTGGTRVPPFDDARTAAGQGTVAAEILEQLGTAPDIVVVPVGGGGLIAGVTTYLREHAPAATIVGVEPAGAASMTAALAAGGPVTLTDLDPFVDGAAVRRIGDLPYAVMRAAGAGAISHSSLPLVTSALPGAANGIGMTQVDEGAVCTEMLGLYQNEGIIAEPAGALAVTALSNIEIPSGATVVCMISGGNNDVSRYGEILERSLVHLGLKHYFLVDFPQEPGALRRFLDEVLGPDDDITLFEYVKRNNRETGAALVGVELGAAEGLSDLLTRMDRSPMQVERLVPGSPAYRYLT